MLPLLPLRGVQHFVSALGPSDLGRGDDILRFSKFEDVFLLLSFIYIY